MKVIKSTLLVLLVGLCVSTKADDTTTGQLNLNGKLFMQRIGSPSYPNGLVNDSQSLFSYTDDWGVWFFSEQDENTSSNGSFSFVLDDDGDANPRLQIVPKSDQGNRLFQVDASGNVGIGAGSPISQLHVNSMGTIDENNGWANFGSNLYYSELGWHRIYGNRGGSNLHMNAPEYSGGQEFRFYVSEANGSRRNIGIIGSSFAYFESKVGIGTYSPDYKLDVNGTMRAKEVIVETGWSDFVFENGYELRSLDEVEAHIEEHGHLPDVPSASVIQEEGLEIAKAQTIMMQKIEELTLYMIEKDKEVASLKEQNAMLLRELKSIRRTLEE